MRKDPTEEGSYGSFSGSMEGPAGVVLEEATGVIRGLDPLCCGDTLRHLESQRNYLSLFLTLGDNVPSCTQ